MIGDLGLSPDFENDPVRHGDREGFRMIPVELLFPNPEQPRRDFPKEALAELANSLRENGIIQPLIARPSEAEQGAFQIVAGERRWRAAQIAQIHELPVVVRKFTDSEALQVALVENIQRSNLNPMEEARAYRTLMDQFGQTQEIMSKSLGKSRSQISNIVRLLTLPDEVKRHIEAGDLTIGHARAIVPTKDPAALSRQIVQKGLSVRQAERLAKRTAAKGKANQKSPGSQTDIDTHAMERDLSLCLGANVRVKCVKGSNRGKLKISFKSLDHLDRLCGIIVAGHISQAS